MPTKTLTANILKLYKASGLTQREFAEKYNSNQKAFWTYTKGAAPPAEFLLSLCQDKGIDLEILKTKKLEINSSGNIKNLPSKQIEISKLRSDLALASKKYLQAHAEFMKEVDRVSVEIDKLKKR